MLRWPHVLTLPPHTTSEGHICVQSTTRGSSDRQTQPSRLLAANRETSRRSSVSGKSYTRSLHNQRPLEASRTLINCHSDSHLPAHQLPPTIALAARTMKRRKAHRTPGIYGHYRLSRSHHLSAPSRAVTSKLNSSRRKSRARTSTAPTTNIHFNASNSQAKRSRARSSNKSCLTFTSRSTQNFAKGASMPIHHSEHTEVPVQAAATLHMNPDAGSRVPNRVGWSGASLVSDQTQSGLQRIPS